MSATMKALAEPLHGAPSALFDHLLPENYLEPKPIHLPSDPITAVSVAYESGAEQAPLVVFLNGLALPSSSFCACIGHFYTLLSTQAGARLPKPGVLTWDRYGQGGSEKQQKKHDALDVVATLHELLQVLRCDGRPLLFVANSIGCALARLYTSSYPNNVKALLLLDSIIANTDFVSIFREPTDPEALAKLSDEERKGMDIARQKMQTIFHPSAPSMEGFDRSCLPEQLPHSDQPRLTGDPWITVLGHDHELFAKDSEERLGIPASVVHRYMNAEWDRVSVPSSSLCLPRFFAHRRPTCPDSTTTA